MDVRLYNESVITICGPSASGKSVFVQNLVANRGAMFREPVNNVHWFFAITPPPVVKSEKIHLHAGRLTPGWSNVIQPKDIVIIDDLMDTADSDAGRELTNAFTRLAHHRPCTLVYITQNLFSANSRDNRTRNLNSHYLVLMNNPRDALQIAHISRQMFPTSREFLVNVYRHVTQNKAYSYLFLDFRQETPSQLRVRTGIFPKEVYRIYINNATGV